MKGDSVKDNFMEREKTVPPGVKLGEMNKYSIDCFYTLLEGFNQKIQEQICKKLRKQFLWCLYIYLGLQFTLKFPDRFKWLCDGTPSILFFLL